MASDFEIGRRFRAVNDWCVRSSGVYAAGWPNFHSETYHNPLRTVYGHFLLKPSIVHWRDVPATEYGATDMRTRFTGAYDYAVRHGYQHGFPNFHEANYGQGVVYGTFLILPGACEWRDVPAAELGLGTGDPTRFPMNRWFTGASDYAARRGYAAAMPNGHYANYGGEYVCGVVVFPPGKAAWADIRGRELGLWEDSLRPPDPPKQMTVVPNIVGLLSSKVNEVLEAARLRQGYVRNFTYEYRSDRLVVAEQDIEAGKEVIEGTRVSYGLKLAQQPQGVKSVVLVNRHQQSRPVEIYHLDSAVGVWSSKGTLYYGGYYVIPFASGRMNWLVAVDRGLINCNGGGPENISCQRFNWRAVGDSGGSQVELHVQ
ncbi:PASTA domain-containing protein [Pontibacter toksunensis]|uniref:PASTA domain-containing protein n=1 Tax=Pontibacter toksunensis TaxID=1332631 RepID=A0ABW6C315_9BACT